MRKALLTVLAAALLVPATAMRAQLQGLSEPTVTLPGGAATASVPFESYRRWMVLEAKVAGSAPLRFILDSGAPIVVLASRELGEQLPLQIIGQARIGGAGDGEATTVALASAVKVELEGLFPPGNYRISLNASKVSEAEYKLSLQRLDRFACPTDCESNDNIDFASPFPANHVIEGRVNEWRDADWYEMPVFEQATEVIVTSEVKKNIQIVQRAYSPKSIVDWGRESSTWRGTIPAGTATYLQVQMISLV